MTTTARDTDNRLTLSAYAHLAAAQDARTRYHESMRQAIAQHGDLPLGFTYTSGCYNTAWPEDVKDRLRFYARLIGEQTDLARECWLRAGRRIHTFREVARPYRQLPDGRESYY